MESNSEDKIFNSPEKKKILNIIEKLGCTKEQVYTKFSENLKKAILHSIENADKKKIEKLIHKTTPFITEPDLCQIPITLYKNQPSIPDSILEKLSEDDKIYEKCPLEIKRQIWKKWKWKDRFINELMPLFKNYESDLNLRKWSKEMKEYGLHSTDRRKNSSFLAITSLIDKSNNLYEKVMSCVKQFYSRTGSLSFCTLRFDLLMYMHELEIKEIYNKDPCYKLAWCFDASLQYQTLRIKEARLFFDGVKSKDPSYADISMIIANPYNCNMLADQIFLKLKELSVSKKPITDDEDLIWMTNILNLGFTSRTMIQKNNFKVQKFDKDITEIFYPAIINMIAENEAKENIKEKDDKVKSPTESDSSNKKTAQSEYLTDDVISVIQKSDIALKVFIFYLFNCLENIDANALGSALKVVKNNHEKFGDDFLQTFSSILSKIIAEQNYLFASSSQFKTVVIDKFLTTSVDLSSSLHELALKIVMELMRAGAIWDKFTAWIDKIFTTGKIDDEEKFQRLYKEIYDFGTSQSKDLVIERFSWHYAPNMLKFLDIDVPPTPPPAPITPSPSIMQPSPNTLTGNMMPWNNMRPPVEAGNMNPMMNNSMNPMNSINPMIQMGMQPGMNSNMNPGINQIQMNPMNSMNPMINNNMNGPNGMNMMNNMNKMGGYNRYGYNNHNSGYRPRGGKYRNNRSYTPHYNNNNNYYNNNGPGKRSYNDMDPGFNHYNNDQSYKNRNMNNNMNNNNNNNSENIYYG